jgi:hypothetical protein
MGEFARSGSGEKKICTSAMSIVMFKCYIQNSGKVNKPVSKALQHDFGEECHSKPIYR